MPQFSPDALMGILGGSSDLTRSLLAINRANTDRRERKTARQQDINFRREQADAGRTFQSGQNRLELDFRSSDREDRQRHTDKLAEDRELEARKQISIADRLASDRNDAAARAADMEGQRKQLNSIVSSSYEAVDMLTPVSHPIFDDRGTQIGTREDMVRSTRPRTPNERFAAQGVGLVQAAIMGNTQAVDAINRMAPPRTRNPDGTVDFGLFIDHLNEQTSGGLGRGENSVPGVNKP